MHVYLPYNLVVDREDKKQIGEFLKSCPEDLRDWIGAIDFVAIDRSDNEIFDLCIKKILRIGKL